MSTQNKKVAIVTGGGSGLGLAIAEKFSQAGIQTIIIGNVQYSTFNVQFSSEMS